MPEARDILFETTAPQIRVRGAEQPALARDLLSLEVAEDTAGLKRLRCTLAGSGPTRGGRDEGVQYLDARLFDFGTEIEVAMGPRSAARTVFVGKISAIGFSARQGAGPEVEVHAEDRLQDLRMTRRFETYEDTDDADIVRRVASRHGLSAAIELDGPVHALVQQWNATDLAFLRERAAWLGGEVWLDGTTLHVATRERRLASGNRVTLIQGNDLLSVSLSADLAEQRSLVTVGGFDEVAEASIEEAGAGSLVAAEVEAGQDGPTVLASAFGDRASYRLRDVPLTTAAARAGARAALLARARRFVTAEGVTLGTPDLRVGTAITLERLAPRFDGGGYVATRVEHSFDVSEGYRTRFSAERPWIGTP